MYSGWLSKVHTHLIKNKMSYWKLLLPVLIINAILVASTFTFFNDPGHGAYYLAKADSLLLTGEVRDLTTIPPSRAGHTQIGIVYLITFFKYFLGNFWPVPYTILVSLLWTGAIISVYNLSDRLFHSNIAKIFISAAIYLQFDSLNSICSYLNESVYIPCFYIISALWMKQIIDRKQFSEFNYIIAIFVGVFYFTGIFFRTYHIVILAVSFLWICLYRKKYILHVTMMCMIVILLFLLSTESYDLNNSLFFIKKIFTIYERFSIRSFSYLIGAFSFFTYFDRFLGYGHWFLIIISLGGATFFSYGLYKIRKKCNEIGTGIFIFYSLSLVFFFLIGFELRRYFLPMNFITILVMLYGIQELFTTKVFNNIIISICILGMLCFGILIYNYTHHKDKYNTWAFLSVLKKFDNYLKTNLLVDNYLLYSSETRHPYWYLGKRSCIIAPEECASKSGFDGRNYSVFYLGERSLYESKYKHNYLIDKTIVEPINGIGVWTLAPFSSYLSLCNETSK